MNSPIFLIFFWSNADLEDESRLPMQVQQLVNENISYHRVETFHSHSRGSLRTITRCAYSRFSHNAPTTALVAPALAIAAPVAGLACVALVTSWCLLFAGRFRRALANAFEHMIASLSSCCIKNIHANHSDLITAKFPYFSSLHSGTISLATFRVPAAADPPAFLPNNQTSPASSTEMRGNAG